MAQQLQTKLEDRTTPTKLQLSVLIPICNERENLNELSRRLHQVLGEMGVTYEVVFVDDGSTDGSFEVLRQFHQEDQTFKIVRLRRNFGKTAAFAAGLEFCSGDVIVTMDGDLQNYPEDIPILLAKIHEGYDVVSGWRAQRKDPFLNRRLPSIIANRLISWITGVKLHDYGCFLKAYRAEVAHNLDLYGDMHRFTPALASWMGTSIAEVPVQHAARKHGKSKYGIARTLGVVLDIITVRFMLSYSARPMRLFGLLGFLTFLAGFGISLYLSVLRIFYGVHLSERPLLLLGVLLIVIGVQLVTMGLLGEMLVRIYHESLRKPIYAVREVLGNETAASLSA